jgi:hypothetical protein
LLHQDEQTRKARFCFMDVEPFHKPILAPILFTLSLTLGGSEAMYR